MSTPKDATNATVATIATGRVSEKVYQKLPATLADITRHIERERERDVVLTGALPVIAGALHNTRFKYGGMWNGLNLYTAVIARAARGKGKMRHARKIGKPLNQTLHKRSEKALEEWRERKKSDDQEAGPKPEWQRFFLPADTSASKLKEGLATSPSAVMFETEFKTLSTVLEQDWGKFRDVLLKGFQNEPVEVERQKLEKPRLIEHPAPSMAVSGTPGTFSEVIADTEDGLFSRFAFYQFDGEASWFNQFGDVEPTGLDHAIDGAADRLEAMYREQSKRDEPLYLTFTDRSQKAVNKVGEFITEHWNREGVREELHSCLRRAAVRSLRIAGIMRLLRHHEQGEGLYAPKTVEVGMEDVEIGLRLAFTYLTHSLQIAEQFGVKDERQNLRRDQVQFLETLPSGQFETSDAKEVAEEVGVPDRTFRRWLTKWDEDTDLIEKVSRGVWEKVTPDRDSERVPGVVSVDSVISVIFDEDAGPVGALSSKDGAAPEQGGGETT